MSNINDTMTTSDTASYGKSVGSGCSGLMFFFFLAMQTIPQTILNSDCQLFGDCTWDGQLATYTFLGLAAGSALFAFIYAILWISSFIAGPADTNGYLRDTRGVEYVLHPDSVAEFQQRLASIESKVDSPEYEQLCDEFAMHYRNNQISHS